MRTTLRLDDDAFDLARLLAKGRGVSIGQAVSDLIRKGINAAVPIRTEHGLAVFDLPDDSPIVTMERVKRLDDETR